MRKQQKYMQQQRCSSPSALEHHKQRRSALLNSFESSNAAFEDIIAQHAVYMTDFVHSSARLRYANAKDMTRAQQSFMDAQRLLASINRKWVDAICVPDDVISNGSARDVAYRKTVEHMIESLTHYLLGAMIGGSAAKKSNVLNEYARFFCALSKKRKKQSGHLQHQINTQLEMYYDNLDRLRHVLANTEDKSKLIADDYHAVAFDCIVSGRAMGLLLDEVLQ